MLKIEKHEITSTVCDSLFCNDVGEHFQTIIECTVGNHKLSFKIAGQIRDPKAWIVDHALKKIIHHCGYHDLLQFTNENEEDYHMMLCEDDFYDEEIRNKGGKDIRAEICDYNNDMCYKSDMFFTYYNFLKDKVPNDEILKLYIELLDVKKSLSESEFIELSEEYDIYIHQQRQLISLIKYIKVIK